MADDQTPNVSDGIVKARAAGYSDDDIANHLAEKLPGVKQARDAGYSNSGILAHLAGGSSEATVPPAPTAKDIGVDLAKSAAIGPVKGAISVPGLPGDVAALAKAGIDWVGSKLPD